MSPVCRIALILPLVLGLLAVAVPARADIYRYVDANGIVYFTNTPTDNRYAFYMKERGGRSTLGDVIRRYSTIYRLEEALVRAVIKVESDFNPRAVSRKGAMGFMQLIPETAKDMQVRNPFDPEENIRGGSRYLRLMLDQFGGDLELALAAYNAGPNSVKRHGGIPPFPETVAYVGRVKRFLDHYRKSPDTVL
jgi:soluble lytic murein transglycosylase